MTTTLYLRAATSPNSGTLPTTEQSSRTSANDFEANQATNRALSTSKGGAQTVLSNASTATTSQTDYYIGRWVSPALNQTSVAANTWTINFAADTSDTNSNFPASTTGGYYVNIYVWKPSNGTKYGTIADGATGNSTAGPQIIAETCYQKTISGSAVSSLTSGDAVIVFEMWARCTQTAASSYTQNFYYNGSVTTTSEATSVTNHASNISTPENLSLATETIDTKLYLHSASSAISGTLPTAEQSTKTVTTNCNFEGSQTTNRSMNTTIGASQATLTLSTPANTSANTFYVSRWVSEQLNQTSIAAGTWTYNFAARESNTNANYPVTSSNKAVWVNFYVWKPSNGTKYGTILDGNTAATVTEGTANQERSQQATFSGSAVSSLTANDAVLVFEAWFAVTQGSATSYTDDFFYDGTTETAGGSTVSNHASFLSIESVIAFAGLTQVNQSYTHKYKLAQLATQTRTHKYKIVGRATASKTHKYKIRSLVNVSKTFKYKIVGRATAAKTFLYKIVGRATASKTHKYKIRQLATNPFTHKYKIRQLAAQVFTHKYKIRQLATLAETFKYKIIGRATVSKTFKYKIIGRANQIYTHQYKIRRLATASRTHIYKIRALVNSTKTHKYKIAALASQTFIHKYKLRQLASQSFTHIYQIIADQLRATQSFTHKYKIRQLSNQTYTHKYRIKLLVSVSKTFKYNIRQLATRARTFKYNIRQLATRIRTHKYRILTLVNTTKTFKYRIRLLVSVSKTFKYKIIGRVATAFTHKYNIIAFATRTFTHKYKIRLLVPAAVFTHTYKITGLASRIFTFIYNLPLETDLIPLWKQSTGLGRKVESGFNAFMQRTRFRESESYIRQLGGKVKRKRATGRVGRTG